MYDAMLLALQISTFYMVLLLILKTFLWSIYILFHLIFLCIDEGQKLFYRETTASNCYFSIEVEINEICVLIQSKHALNIRIKSQFIST